MESEGIPTTQISLIREHTERMKPPRALWVPFDLGRPLGAPDDPGFQKKVLLAALGLLEEHDGPVIRDFPEDAPASEHVSMPAACPVSFGTPSGQRKAGLLADFREEAEGLQNWFDLGLKKRGRTTTGTSKLSLGEIVKLLSVFAEGEMPTSPVSGVSVDVVLKLACEDLKAYYTEAISAQPGGPQRPDDLADWFWGQTVAARVIGKVRACALQCEGNAFKLLGTVLLIPRNQRHRFASSQ